MNYRSELLNLKEGDKVLVNGINLKVTRIDSEVNVDRSRAPKDIKVTESGRNIFLSTKDEEYHIWVDIKKDPIILEKIKRKHISTPWEYEVIEKSQISKVII